MLELIEFLAVLAAGLYGVLLARRKELDVVGVFSVAFLVAFGGGTLRDLFLDRHPLFWIEKDHYPVVIFGLSLITSATRRVPRVVQRLLPIVDALGLGLFSIAGAGVALESGTSAFIASLLGVMTGTFGGVLGDVVCNEIPSLFRSAPLYATCSFAGCWVYLGGVLLESKVGILDSTWTTGASVATIVLLRLAAVRWDLRFPNLSRPAE